jgi:hypothetical protein
MDIRAKIKSAWKAYGREAVRAVLTFLIAALAFGAGWLVGSRTFTRPPIIVNCPPSLYEPSR